MKLLIITRKVDARDDRMGFFVDWINEFSKHVDSLTVISMQEGSRDGVSGSVDVEFVGGGKLRKFFVYRKLLKKTVPKTDGVFVHMMPIYANLAGPIVRKNGKKMLLWYMHKSVDYALEKTSKWVSGYITASKKSFRMDTSLPVHVVGHAILTQKFKNPHLKSEISSNDTLKLLTIGRISPSKRIEVIIEAVNYLIKNRNLNPILSIVGSPPHKHEEYLKNLINLVDKHGIGDNINFVGPKQHKDLPGIFSEHDIFINASETGSLDKAVLEAMASGVVPLTSNEAFKELFTDDLESLLFAPGDYRALADCIINISKTRSEQYKNMVKSLNEKVVKNHDISNTIKRIVSLYVDN